nr:monodehydroascorbate reductase [Tanacetum cinerariifolium]
MTDMTAPTGQAPTMAPPVRTDDQILPRIRWVPIGKSNCYLDIEKSQGNLIHKIAVDLLKNTNFFRAFTASSTIPSIYIQQFWDTIQYDKTVGYFRCQLDEQWFVLTKDTLREALQITPVNNNQAFISPPTAEVLINFVNELGYPKLARHVLNVVTNDMFQPWRALITIINLCLTGKTSGFERPRAPVLQILWGIIKQANIDYAERIWEEFTQSIHTFIEDKQNLRHMFHPRPDSPLHLPNEEPVLGYLKFSAKGTKREVFGMPIPGSLMTAEIREAFYYQEYLAKVAQHRRYLASKTRGVQDPPAPKPTQPARKPKSKPTKAPPRPAVTSTQPAPTSALAELQAKKSKQATETSDKPPKAKKSKYGWVSKKRSLKHEATSEAEDVPVMEPQVAAEDAELQKVLEESMKTAYALPKGPLPPVVIREPESRKYQPLPEVPGKGEAKVTEEQSDSKEESEKDVLGATEEGNDEDQAGPDPGAQAEGQTGIDAGTLDEGQAGSNPNEMSEGQAGPDPGNVGDEEQSIPSPVVHAASDHEHMDLDVADVSPQPSTEQLDEGFTATAYPKVQENLKLAVEEQVLLEEPDSSSGTLSSLQHLSRDISFGDQFFDDKPSDADKNVETKVESMFKATTTDTTTTTTTTLPPPQAQQQSTAETIMVKRISELEHIMANLIQVNKDTEERLDKHRARLYMLEQLDIPQQVSIAVSEVVTYAVDWAMQVPLRNRFRDLPEADMKEILHQRMWETESYKTHEDHKQLFEALKKSMNCDHSEELAQDLAEARKKKKKSHESPKMPPGSPSHQPLPPPLLAGPSGPSGAPGAFGSSQVPPPPPAPPLSTSQESPSKGSAAPSPSKTAASAEYQAWTTTDINLRPSISLTLADLEIDEDMSPDEQAQLSDDEDIESAHIPTVNLRQGWWKPFEEEQPTTPEPAWSIRSSDVPTGDIATFIDWFCKRRGITELKPQDLKGPAYEIIKVFHSDVIHLQYQMEECHKLLTDSVDDPLLRHNVSKLLPLGGPPGQVTIQSDFFFNKDLEYLRYSSKGRRPALSISKMKAAYYPGAGLEQMVPDQTHMWILNVVRIEVFSMYGYDYMKKIVLRRADLNEHVIAKRDFKYMYPSDFKDLYLLNLQGHLNHLPPKDKKILTTAVNQWTRQLVIRQHVEDFQLRIESYQTQLNLTKPQWDATGFEYKHDYTVIDSPRAQIDEALDYRVKEFRINRMNLGLNTRFWTRKDVDRCKAFMFAIQRCLKTRRIFRNMKSFVGRRVREGDYRLLKRTE